MWILLHRVYGPRKDIGQETKVGGSDKDYICRTGRDTDCDIGTTRGEFFVKTRASLRQVRGSGPSI